MLAAIVLVAFFETGARQAMDERSGDRSDTQVQESSERNVPEVIPREDDFDFWQDPFPQWAMAAFAAVATLASIWSIVLLRDTLHQTILATRAATKATEEAIEANKLQRINQRPWLDFELANFDAVRVVDGQLSIAMVKAENIGSSIAHNCRFFSEFYEGGTREYVEVHHGLIERAIAWTATGSIVLPNKSSSHLEFVFFPETILKKGEGAVLGAIGVCVIVKYSDSSQEGMFYTSKNYLISKEGGNMVFMRVGQTYSGSDIALTADSNRTIFR